MATASKPLSLPGDVKWIISYVAAKTGLRPDVVTAWYLAEGGPKDNPFNIGPGRHYGSPYSTAKATVELLHTPRYAPILRSASQPAQAQLHAIAASPWDAGHYGGDGRNLRGAYQRVVGSHGSTGGVVGALGATGTAIQQGESAVAAAPGKVGSALDPANWFTAAKEPAARALLYLTFTALAIAFLVLGGVRAAGGSMPRRGFRPPNLQAAGFPEGY